MPGHRTTFNHVGLCVADRERSRCFYEGLLGFQFWWELDAPDDGTDQLLQLEKPVGLLSVPGRGPDKQDSLAARVQAELPTARVVHRLDMETSGVMVMALSSPSPPAQERS